MLVVVMCSSVTIRSLAKIFSSRSCGNRERGAGMARAIRGAAAQAKPLPAPSSLAVAQNHFKCRFAARQKRRAACLVKDWGAVALARVVLSLASRDRHASRQRSLSGGLKHSKFSPFWPSLGSLPEPAGCPPSGASGALAGRHAGTTSGTPPIPARRPSCPVDTQTAPVHSPPRSPSASHSPPCPRQLLPMALCASGRRRQ